MKSINGILLLGLSGNIQSGSAVDVSLVLAGTSLNQKLADSSITVLGGKVERGRASSKGLGSWHSSVVKKKLEQNQKSKRIIR